jgi:acylphosphatase
MAKTKVHILVNGRVQGVYFRQTTMQQARSHGVTGWVRNLPDGCVEAVFEGEETAVKALVNFCRKGPKGALVTDFAVNLEPFKGESESFEILY